MIPNIIKIEEEMELCAFKNLIKLKVPAGIVLKNPCKETSTVLSYTDKGIYYRRGKSRIFLTFEDCYETFDQFKDQRVTTLDLKVFRPHIYDSKAEKPGHSCNCTMVFLLFKKAGLASIIQGKGVRGNPFYLELFS